MATGRIGVTPTLGVRWSKAPTGGTTSLSGLDDNSVSLVYSVGYEQVYRNGVLLSRTNDYTATTGNTITLIDATITGDIIEVFANELVPLTDAISKGQFTAKGALLSATAASTPGVLTVGSNAQVLTADSTTSTGLKWATPAAGGMTLLDTLTLSGSSVTSTTFSSSYKQIMIYIKGAYNSVQEALRMRMNANTSGVYSWYYLEGTGSYVFDRAHNETYLRIGTISAQSSAPRNHYSITTITRPSDSDVVFVDAKEIWGSGANTMNQGITTGNFQNTSAPITSITVFPGSGTFSAGTAYIYGVN